ncbi:MarR family winged helix-turn-helix transcriptional regulator [Subtercola endophyticus]|uniref:MarR family winged helix-turn-helix transcriptional regulator n=1 Tax=Subtercola endophyticus TaxID=2895559 RepID=UPI001E2925B0|nr:MarR family transcriptional regulator [Subtercola endophyticus]UFS59981.1 MarR family transcriptional regulator [Subtercola endophyticus]
MTTRSADLNSASTSHRDAIDRLRAQWAVTRPELDTSPAATIGRLLRVAKHVTSLSDARLAEFGISRGEFDVLSAVRRAPAPPTPTELAKDLLASNASITKRLVLLEKSQLAVRIRSASDGRVVTVSLTPAGVALIDRALPAQLGVEAALIDVLGENERDQFESTLRRLLRECENRP